VFRSVPFFFFAWCASSHIPLPGWFLRAPRWPNFFDLFPSCPPPAPQRRRVFPTIFSKTLCVFCLPYGSTAGGGESLAFPIPFWPVTLPSPSNFSPRGHPRPSVDLPPLSRDFACDSRAPRRDPFFPPALLSNEKSFMHVTSCDQSGSNTSRTVLPVVPACLRSLRRYFPTHPPSFI